MIQKWQKQWKQHSKTLKQQVHYNTTYECIQEFTFKMIMKEMKAISKVKLPEIKSESLQKKKNSLDGLVTMQKRRS